MKSYTFSSLFGSLILLTLFFYLATLPLSAQQENLRIECIMIGQTDIWDIGKACDVSMNHCEKWIREIESATGIPANITRIEGEDYNRNFVGNFLENFQLDDPENTIVIFYGTGHGFNYQDNVLKYPVFGVHPDRKKFSNTEFDRFALSLQKDVHEPLLETGARLVLTIGELCNELIDKNTPGQYRPNQPNLDIRSMNPLDDNPRSRIACPENYEELFLETRGDIIAASSERGQLSYTSGLAGGVFFGKFLESFD
ncbi:MAG: hypothetical protein AAFP19_24985, partial [Bacteroidota bacterium]